MATVSANTASVSKGVDCYSYGYGSSLVVVLEGPGGPVEAYCGDGFAFNALQIDSSNVSGSTNFSGEFAWYVYDDLTCLAEGNNVINSLTGNVKSGTMTDLFKMTSIVSESRGRGYAVSYGFYDAGSGLSGLPSHDQFYISVTRPFETWMGDLMDIFPEGLDYPFYTFALPGAHDAGMNSLDTITPMLSVSAWDLLKTALYQALPRKFAGTFGLTAAQNFAMTQKDSITMMLNLGVRYFDFRPGSFSPAMVEAGAPRGLYHQHLAIPGMSYPDFLIDVLTWLSTHPTEIVVVSCNTQGFASTVIKPTAQLLNDYLLGARQDSRVSTEMVNNGDATALGQSISSLLASNTRLIFLNQIDGETTKYDSYNDSYKTLDPAPIVTALAAMNKQEQAKYTYTVLQLQGTCTGLPAVIASSAIGLSKASSPLMATKAKFDQTTHPWVRDNADLNLSNQYLMVLLNDFIDGTTVSLAWDLSMQRMGLGLRTASGGWQPEASPIA